MSPQDRLRENSEYLKKHFAPPKFQGTVLTVDDARTFRWTDAIALIEIRRFVGGQQIQDNFSEEQLRPLHNRLCILYEGWSKDIQNALVASLELKIRSVIHSLMSIGACERKGHTLVWDARTGAWNDPYWDGECRSQDQLDKIAAWKNSNADTAIPCPSEIACWMLYDQQPPLLESASEPQPAPKTEASPEPLTRQPTFKPEPPSTFEPEPPVMSAFGPSAFEPQPPPSVSSFRAWEELDSSLWNVFSFPHACRSTGYEYANMKYFLACALLDEAWARLERTHQSYWNQVVALAKTSNLAELQPLMMRKQRDVWHGEQAFIEAARDKARLFKELQETSMQSSFSALTGSIRNTGKGKQRIL